MANFFEENCFYDKPIDSVKTIDASIFDELRIEKENFLPAFLFLVEHFSIEIDLKRLKSTVDDETGRTPRKINVLPTNFVQNCEKAQILLEQIFQIFSLKNLDEFLSLSIENRPICLEIFDSLNELLRETSIEKNPFVFHILFFVVTNCRTIFTSERLDSLCHFSLSLIEENKSEIQFLGLDLIERIRRTFSSSELELFGRSSLIL